MSRKIRKKYSDEFKLKVVLAAIKGDMAVDWAQRLLLIVENYKKL